MHLAGSYLVQFKHCYMYGHDYELKAFDQNFFFFFFFGGVQLLYEEQLMHSCLIKKKVMLAFSQLSSKGYRRNSIKFTSFILVLVTLTHFYA